MIIEQPKNTFQIKQLWAYLSFDEGGEGLIGMKLPDGQHVPFVCADEVRIKELRPYAKQLAKLTNKRIILARFSTKEIIEEITGE